MTTRDQDTCACRYCLCGCGKIPNVGSRFKQGHDQRAYGRLLRLAENRRKAGDDAVLSDDLLDCYEQNPDCRVVREWYARDILKLAGRR